MISKQLKEDINQLDLSEKLQLVTDIWDSIAQDNQDLPLADWQKNELNKRYQEYKAGKLTLHEWEGVHEHLRDSHKK